VHSEWIYGYYVEKGKAGYIYCSRTTETTEEGWRAFGEKEYHTYTTKRYKTILIDKETLGYYIGINDKKGREIYEGDRVQYGYSDKQYGYIEWDDNGLRYVLRFTEKSSETQVVLPITREEAEYLLIIK
jgi:uncharacterized phage protein (TIGR01671 family)